MTRILRHQNVADISFDSVFKSAKSLRSSDYIWDYYLQELFIRLDSITLTSIENFIAEWDSYQEDVLKIQSFTRFIGRQTLLEQESLLPKWKFKEKLNSLENKAIILAKNEWRNYIHSQAIQCLSSEFNSKILESLHREIDQTTKKLIYIYKELDISCTELISTEFTKSFNLTKSNKPQSRLQYLISQTQKLAPLFGMESVQRFTLLPFLRELLPPLISSREEDVMLQLKDILLSQLADDYCSIVEEEMQKSTLSVDFFSLSAFYRYFSKLLWNDQSVKKRVSQYINTNDQFSEQFISVLFAHIEIPNNLEALSVLLPLYSNPDLVSKELCRSLALRIFQKQDPVLTKEKDFLHLLGVIFGQDFIRAASSLLNDSYFFSNLTIISSSLTSMLTINDSSEFPEELQSTVVNLVAKHTQGMNNKKFQITAAFSKAFVKMQWGGSDERLVIMTVLQYRILQMVAKGQNNFSVLKSNHDIIVSALKFLIKANILKKAPGNRFVFAEVAPKEKRINTYNAAINVRFVEKVKEEQSQNHTMSIQSVIGRLMKANRRMDESIILDKVYDELSDKFKLFMDDIKDVIQQMIKAQYIERDPGDNRYLLYIP